jgi:hypothetical protein
LEEAVNGTKCKARTKLENPAMPGQLLAAFVRSTPTLDAPLTLAGGDKNGTFRGWNGRNPGTDVGEVEDMGLHGPTRRFSTDNRIGANASFRPSEREVTHGTL